MNDAEPKYRVVVMGKTGSGKSFVCNRLIGRDDNDVFPEYSGMGGNTTQIKTHKAVIDDKCIEVVDTVDTTSVTPAAKEVLLKTLHDILEGNPVPTAFLFTLPMNTRFTPEDHKLYRRFYTELVPKKFRNNLIIIFNKIDGESFQSKLTDLDTDGNVVPERLNNPNIQDLIGLADNRCIAMPLHLSEEKRLEVFDSIVKFVESMSVTVDEEVIEPMSAFSTSVLVRGPQKVWSFVCFMLRRKTTWVILALFSLSYVSYRGHLGRLIQKTHVSTSRTPQLTTCRNIDFQQLIRNFNPSKEYKYARSIAKGI